MKFYLPLFAAFIFISLSTFSQDNVTVNDSDSAYNKTIDTRAGKIVATLCITDSSKAIQVKNCIADQYKNLNNIYSSRDFLIKSIKENQGNTNKEAISEQVSRITEQTTARTDSLHKIYISQLSAKLTPKQVDQVKDGMTYNVLHVTYNGYNQMIRTLTKEQNDQIMAWLIEAREHAMDAESADKKHAWFGKYKGRINNYLSAAGYDLKKEGEEWQKRIAEEAEKNKKAKGN